MAYRKILYRGKLAEKQTQNALSPKNRKKYFADGWVYGFYVPERSATMFGDVQPLASIIKTGDPHDITTGMWFDVNPDTVGEFTGFNDVDGKPIFEGDIVTLSYAGDTLYAVIWAEAQARFLLTDGESVEDFDDFYVFETKIVGNIYDNPDIAPKSEV